MSDSHLHDAWCGIHQCHPLRCWDEHNPQHAQYLNQKSQTAEELAERIKADHRKKQDQLVQCPDCGKYTQNMMEHWRYRCKVAKKQRKESRDPNTKGAA